MTSTAMSYKTLPPAKQIVEAVAKVIGDAPRPISLHEPYFTANEAKYVNSCIEDGWVSSVGAFVDRFEKELAAYSGTMHASVIVNGTCALQLALTVLGLRPDEEVLIPSLTFVATANAVVHAGGVPHFVEVEESSLGIDPVALDKYLESIVTVATGNTMNRKTGRTIRALMPVHVFGHPCQLMALRKVAEKYNLILLEDATEALGSFIGGKPVGSKGTLVFSFNGNKILTTGGGGAILTDDEMVYRRVKHLSTTAKQTHPWQFTHDDVAWNFRMPNLNAALGCAQLEELPKFIAAKRALAEQYIEVFSGIDGVGILPEPKGTASNYWLVTLLAKSADVAWQHETLQLLHEAKFMCRPVWTPLHQLTMYHDAPRADLTLTESLAYRIINLPSSVKLGIPYV